MSETGPGGVMRTVAKLGDDSAAKSVRRTILTVLRPASLRMRRCRARRAAGVEIISVELRPEVITAFLAHGWLSEAASRDKAALACAAADLLARWAAGTLTIETP